MTLVIDGRGAAFVGAGRSGPVWLSGRLVPVAVFAAMLALLSPGAAWADCTPQAGSNVTATCTGTTVNQADNPPPSTAGTDGYGAIGESNVTVTVEPGASVTGTGYGITFDSGTVTNFGTVAGNSGILLTPGTGNLAVINSGAITSLSGNSGIFTNTTGITSVVNSGTIGGGAYGINARNGTSIVTNSGTITGSSTAIVVGVGGGTGTVINSGTISGGLAALIFGDADDTLTLLPGSVLIGPIHLGGGADTVNFQTGNQNLTFDSTLAGDTVNFLGGIPHAVSTSSLQVVTVDPTPFALTDRTLMDFTGSVSAILDDRFHAMGGVGTGQGVAYMPVNQALAYLSGSKADTRSAGAAAALAYADPMPAQGASVAYSDGTTLWGRGFGGHRDQPASGVLLGSTTNFYGGLIGGDKQLSSTLRFGAFLGGGNIDTQVNLGMDHDTSNIAFGGLFARKDFGASFLSLAVQAGHSWNDEARTINNNTLPNGIETAKASFGGWYVAPEATLGHAFQMPASDGSFVLTPSVRLRYLHAAFDGYTESGSTANLTVGSRALDDFEERAQLKATMTHALASGNVLTTDVHGGVLGSQRLGGSTISATLLSQAIPFATPGANNVWGGYAGAGLALHAGRATFSLSGEFTHYSDNSNVLAAEGGVSLAF